jgi:clan AA aspartic protease (TIGR02281 family)
MLKRILLIICILISQLITAQKTIEMTPYNGVYKIDCKVNGIPMEFILDTGASDVSLSSTEALFLIKQGLITEEDILGSTTYQNANGKILEGTKIKLKTIEVAGIEINDITATVVDELKAPLLLGQSFLSKLGPIEIDGNKLTIKSEESSDYKSNMMEGIDFLNAFLENYQIENDTIHIVNAIVELRETELSGYSFWGLKTDKNDDDKSSAFIITIDDIQEIKFENIEDNDVINDIIFISNPNSDGFVYTVGEDFYKTNRYTLQVCCTTPKLRTRFMNALKYVLDENKKFIDKKHKF